MRTPLVVASAVVGALAATIAVGQARPQLISVDEIRPGMRGHGMTVFRGTEPERFEVEVIDVLHGFRPDQDLILVRTDHPILDHATTVAGMSGSPIFIDGRLAGAYAYGWPFGKDPIAGVTPIHNMLAEMRRPVRPDAFPGAGALPARRPQPQASRARSSLDPARSPRLAGLAPYLGARRSALDPLADHARRIGVALDPGAARSEPQGLVQAATPLMLGGFNDRVARFMGDALEPFGLMALQAGGTGQARGRGSRRAAGERRAPGTQFVDGGSIGVQLVRGDITATAVGTITHVGDQRLVAFGHPMMDAGQIGLPTATSRVLHVLASTSRSFKIAEAIDPLGTLIHDRQAAIVVDPSLRAATVPVTVRVRGVEGAPRTEWHAEVASHRVLTPMLVLGTIANALGTTANEQTDVVFTADSRVTIEGHRTVELHDIGYMSSGPADPRAISGLRLFQAIEAAYGNPFEETRITNVELDLAVRFTRDVVRILDARTPSNEVDPGATVNVHVTTQRYGEPERVRIVPVQIPERAAGETIKIKIEPGDDVDLENPIPRRLDELLEIVERGHPPTTLAVSLKMPSRGLRFRGHVVRSLPASALDTLQLANDAGGAEPFITQERQLVEVGNVLTGSAEIELRVRETPRNR